MTPAERARRHDQIYREGATRQSLVDMIVARESDIDDLRGQLDGLRELVRGLHRAYVGLVGRYEGAEEALIWEFSGCIEADVTRMRSECEAMRGRFDDAMRLHGIEVGP